MEVQNRQKVGQSCDGEHYDGVLGSLVGGVLGDALGRPTEHIKSHGTIKKKYPPLGIVGISSLKLADYDKDENGNVVVPYTDDTGMTLLVLKVLINARECHSDLNATMTELAQLFVVDMNKKHGWKGKGRKYGTECFNRVKELQTKINDKQTGNAQWWAVGKGSVSGEKGLGGGCGSLMRVHPCGLVFAHNPAEAEKFAVAQSTLTHSHPSALAACAAQAVGIVLALRGEEPKEIVETMIEIAKKYDKKTAYCMSAAHQLAQKANFNSVYEAIGGSQDFYQKHEGFVALDAIAAVVYAFTLYPDNLKLAIQLSVNTPGDSDSIASMTGALVGARTGYQGQLSDKDLQVQLTSNGLEEFSSTAWQKVLSLFTYFLQNQIIDSVSNKRVVKLEGIEYMRALAETLCAIQKSDQKNFQEFTFSDDKFKFAESKSSKNNFWLNKRTLVTVVCYVLCFCFLLKQLNSGLKEIIEGTV